jgi:hypothetical protein
MGRVPRGRDLSAFLNDFVQENEIQAGTVGVIGVVARARLGFFEVEAGDYVVTEVPEHREIASCLGNVSLREGRPTVHAHIVVSDREGHAAGGHLLDGTVVHYAEFWIQALEGRPFERGPDPDTNVTGWVR